MYYLRYNPKFRLLAVTVYYTSTMRWSILALLYLPFCLAGAKKSQEELATLAAAGNGDIKIRSERIFDLLTSPSRNWSASIQFTALDARRRCAPCR
jgi:oligosaccharyltransferase complex subunit gamma